MGKIPWRREWQPTPVFWPGEFQGQSVWRETVHGVAENWTQLCTNTFSLSQHQISLSKLSCYTTKWNKHNKLAEIAQTFTLTISTGEVPGSRPGVKRTGSWWLNRVLLRRPHIRRATVTVLEERATDTVSDTEGASTTERERGCVCVRERESFIQSFENSQNTTVL